MMPLSLQRLIFILLFSVSSTFLLHAGKDKDSICVLTHPTYTELGSIYAPLADGSHPSQYQFAISNPTKKQYQAWLKGNFIPLQGVFSEDAGGGSKADMFSNIKSAVDSARAALAKVQEIGNFISQFDGQSLIKLPVGMERVKEDGTGFIVAINRITLYPTHAELTVYAQAQSADMEEPLIMGAPDIKFTRRGGISLGSLGLLGDINAPILDSMAFLSFKGARILNNNFATGVGTYASFDCDGLQEFNLDADVFFSRKVIMPVDTNRTDTIGAHLDLNIQDGLNDILVAIDIEEPFVHPSKKDVIWTARDIVFDFSEQAHSSAVQFPIADYTPDLPPAMMQLWKGVHIGELSVKLPDDFIGTDSSTINVDSIVLQDIVIDHTGFTGILKLQPVLDLNQGDMDGWGFSIDSLSLHIYQNQLHDFAFNGLINVPLFDNEDDENEEEGPEVNSLRYGAYFDIHEKAYAFSVNETEDRVLKSKMLQASVTLFPTSQLNIIYSQNEGFDVSATLHGVLDVDASLGGTDTTGIQIPSVEFQDFTIANKGQFIRNTGSWNIESVEVALKAFTLKVDNISMVSYADDPQRVDVQFMALVNIGSRDTTSTMYLAAEGGFRLKGKIDILEDGKQDWRYDGFKMDMLHVYLNTPAVEFEGEVIFFEDIPQFGDGFQGKVSLVLKKMGDLGIEAMALFGSVEDYRYFFVDVMTRIPANGLTVAGIDIRGIGGGVYVNMRQVSISQDFEDTATGNILPVFDPEAENGANEQVSAYEQAIIDRLGVSLSGLEYVPDPSVKIGINFGVVVATTGAEEAFNANVVLNIQINDTGGLDHIRLAGYANTMAPISWSGPACEGISIRFEMNYVTGEETQSGVGEFSAFAQVFVNTEHIKGATLIAPPSVDTTSVLPEFYSGVDCDALYYAGGIDIFLSKNDWWINIGIPNPDREAGYPFPHYPIGLQLDNLGPIGGELTAYLDIGNNIPPFPGLPANVAELTGLGNLVANEQDRASGKGFAFGARLVIDNNIGVKGIVEAHLGLDVGFDIMLQKYQDVICVNNNNQPLGFNNWYAAGQAWVYVEGSVSVLSFNVMEAALAAAIQVKGPNPLYGRGAIAGRYSVLGGLKKGEFRFPLEFGKECQIAGGGAVTLDYNIIEGVLPIDLAQNVPVDIKPIISFSYPVDKIVELQVEEGDEMVNQNFMVKLNEFEVKLGEQSIEGDLIFSEDGYSAEFRPTEILHSESDYVIFATAALYEVNGQGAIISTATDEDIETINFTTGESIDYIPISNIANAWPANGQFNYYQGEPVSNMLELASGQDSLLITPENHTAIIRLSNPEEELDVPFTYDEQNNRIDFDLPSLTQGGTYKAQVLFVNESEEDGNKLLMEYYFRVSEYLTFSDKMSAASISPMSLVTGFDYYESTISNLNEPFGKEEIIGLDWMPKTKISTTADLDNTEWMNQFFAISAEGQPDLNLYDSSSSICAGNNAADLSYSIYGVHRQELGILPTKAITLNQDNLESYHIDSLNYELYHQLRDILFQGVNAPEAKINYLVPAVVFRDYVQIRSSTVSYQMIDVINAELDELCSLENPEENDASITLANLNVAFNSDPCRKYFFEIELGNLPCDGNSNGDFSTINLSNILVDKPMDFELSINTNYPIKLKYRFPNQVVSTSNKTLQFPGI